MKKYLVVFEKTENNYSAYIPDVPGCVATGKTIEQTKRNISEALKMHFEGLKEDGIQAPQSITTADFISI